MGVKYISTAPVILIALTDQAANEHLVQFQKNGFFMNGSNFRRTETFECI